MSPRSTHLLSLRCRHQLNRHRLSHQSRWLWLLHPVLTIAVVVSTANHYWLDGIVVLALLAVSVLLLRPPAPDGPVRVPG